MKPLLDKTALFISAATSPFVVFSVVGVATISYYANNLREFFLWNSIFLFLTLIVPLLYILQGVRTGRLTDLHLMLREQRLKPFVVSVVCNILLIVIFYLLELPKPIMILSTILLANEVIFLAITQFWKISIHSATLAGSITTAAVLIDSRFIALYLISPLSIWARVRRHRHNFLQGVAATFLAISISMIIFKLYGVM